MVRAFGELRRTHSANQSEIEIATPDRKDAKYLEALITDPAIAGEFESAWTDSNPYGPGEKKLERGFWVLRDMENVDLSVRHFPTEGATRAATRPGQLPNIGGKEVVAWFHTHPNTQAEGFQPGPSPGDFQTQKGRPAYGTGIIRSHEGYHFFGHEFEPFRRQP